VTCARRCARWLSWIAAAACIIISFLWVRSYSRGHNIDGQQWRTYSPTTMQQRAVGVVTSGGGVQVALDSRTRTFSSAAQLERLRAEGKYSEEWTWNWRSCGTPEMHAPLYPYPGVPGRWPWNRMGIWTSHVAVGQAGDSDRGDVWIVVVPYWLILAMMVLWPSIQFARWWRRHRREGHCRCGYDLRGISGQCPECGSLISNGARLQDQAEPTHAT